MLLSRYMAPKSLALKTKKSPKEKLNRLKAASSPRKGFVHVTRLYSFSTKLEPVKNVPTAAPISRIPTLPLIKRKSS